MTPITTTAQPSSFASPPPKSWPSNSALTPPQEVVTSVGVLGGGVHFTFPCSWPEVAIFVLHLGFYFSCILACFAYSPNFATIKFPAQGWPIYNFGLCKTPVGEREGWWVAVPTLVKVRSRGYLGEGSSIFSAKHRESLSDCRIDLPKWVGGGWWVPLPPLSPLLCLSGRKPGFFLTKVALRGGFTRAWQKEPQGNS